MKIMHIGQLIGGLDIYIKNIVSNTSPDFKYVILYGEADNPQLDYFHKLNVTLHPVSMHRRLSLWKDLKALLQILKFIREEKPDLIHCHSAKGGFLGRVAGWLSGVKTLYTPHAFSFLSTSSKIKSFFFKMLERMAVLDSYLLACSDSERELGLSQVHYAPERTKVWHNSIPFAGANECVKAQNSDDYICYMARPSYQKNPYFLVEVMREVHKLMPNIRFCLLGVGYHSPNITDLRVGIEENGLSDYVDLYSWVSHDECLEHIRQSKLYFTVSRYEGMSLTVLEAMSMGKPIIASDVIGNKDCVFDGENGFLLPFDAKLFASKIAEVVKNEDLRKHLESNSLRLFKEQFFIEDQIPKLANIYALTGALA